MRDPDAALDELFEAAAAARAKAYAPYSRFHVGAAVRGAGGATFSGANVENASYPVGVCAEAVALAAMALAGERRLVEIAVVGEGGTLTTPCGACRQRILEFAGDGDPVVHVMGPDGTRLAFSARALLPHAFGPAAFGR